MMNNTHSTMNLFEDHDINGTNILPYDGEVFYHGVVMNRLEADRFLQYLLNSIDWYFDEAMMFGKHIITKRKVAWYGDKAFMYTYSNMTKTAAMWTPELLRLKQLAERCSGETYNSCLLNLYPTGSEGMGWHSDGEKELKKNGAIASLSFGAERKFSFKHKQSKVAASVLLEHGSLLVMKGTTQMHWLHRLPPTKKIQLPRVNLTFRMMNSNP